MRRLAEGGLVLAVLDARQLALGDAGGDRDVAEGQAEARSHWCGRPGVQTCADPMACISARQPRVANPHNRVRFLTICDSG